MDQDNFYTQRLAMVNDQLVARNIRDVSVLAVMKTIPRHLFVPDNVKKYAYSDAPLGIGYGQTISQPYIVAFMTETAMLDHDAKVLEIGTGSGYQAAILASLCKEVYTIESVSALGERAKALLNQFAYHNLYVRVGDGYKGWPEQAPFDAIIVTAAPDQVPKTLIDQLKENGRLIIPVGEFEQQLIRITRTKDGIKQETLLPVRFVPMVKAKG
ncbi:MAG: protein-L-isoaspartate(D-aspartate) O-methyltransferase [Candidatus Cardinium sp.]|uniref:protein-L-isoaspartate(D-aspartate) O-methyltransferase n=1 Tax=Cardinium endosymbiont of Dermatophagoides farinae TaxID=2597823 RepID=UPI0011830074|nr:protein-L-isoaspartate(D-aspartate) O-methyltransferase [Cardinium endosymbiont of Dermatophagoides farinae]TSJ80761.1 protein-L-isoaspartate(D-aspartate) O-methyltransferase [Cardinium endosymbiont of Dermatophagoides farinae]UWW96759.1 MAG: protein-L-isoaspartate(D-aspartate) O-methyltransferase [Candidatus Cardinium sp.]